MNSVGTCRIAGGGVCADPYHSQPGQESVDIRPSILEARPCLKLRRLQKLPRGTQVTKWVCVTLIVLVNAAMCRGPICAAPPIVAVEVDPTSLSLLGPVAGHTLLVTGTTADGRRLDVAGEAVFRSVTPEVISVDARGLVRPVADGQGSIVIEVAGRSLTVPVVVEGSHSPRQFRFVNDILPLLDKYGCNGAGCHGKAEGQGGFKLSVFASDPQSDYAAMSQAGRGRRILTAAAERPSRSKWRSSSRGARGCTTYRWRGRPTSSSRRRVGARRREPLRDLDRGAAPPALGATAFLCPGVAGCTSLLHLPSSAPNLQPAAPKRPP